MIIFDCYNNAYIHIEKEKIGTIAGIKNLHEWTWPDQEEDIGFIYARILPGIGEWKKWSPAQIEKIQKQRKHEKPNPQYSIHTESSKKWMLPIVTGKGSHINNIICEDSAELIELV
jgi:hypothetical protein